MNRPEHQIRRATINDLAQLRAIWVDERYEASELEKRFTEFQVVETLDGKLIAAIALQIQGNQARIHSEAIGAPEHTEWLRLALWERLQGVARNHGLVRLWADAAHSHWRGWGFQEADGEVIKKLPANFGGSQFVFLQLREDLTPAISLDGELALFRESQKMDALKREQQRRVWNSFAMFIAVIILFFVLYCGFLMFQSFRRGELGAPGGMNLAPPGPGQFPSPTSVPASTTPPAPAKKQ